MSKKIYWIYAVLFFLILSADWVYIFFLSQYPKFITPIIILIPILMPLVLAMVIVALFGIYFLRFWGFLAAYLIIICTIGFSILSYSVIDRTFLLERTYISSLIFINLLLFLVILILEINVWSTKK